jgi:long-chain acyl-CoA synthetase
LVEAGVEPGDRVTILGANGPEWVISFWACALAGAVAVPMNAWWKTDELEFGLADSGTRVLICDERRWDSVRPVRDALADLEHVFVWGTDSPDVAKPFTDLDRGGDTGPVDIDVDEDDIAGIFYTSGTTGRPKGATVTHRQVIANLQNIMVLGMAGAMRASQEGGDAPPELTDKGYQTAALLVVPLFHTTGCHATMVLNYAAGYKLVLMPPGQFDPDVAMQAIEKEKISSVGGVPTILWRILESPNFGKWDLSTVSRISYGGAPASPELVKEIHRAFPKARKALTNAYGLTETASVATYISGKDYADRPSSAGRPAPTIELRVVDLEGTDVALGEPGEIWLKGPTISPHGYWKRPDANDESYTSDRWFKTGDVAKLDDEGFLFIVDRAKDMVIRAGENVYCVEVEEVLYEHPDVIDAAVVGVPHRTLGEEVKAVVHCRSGAETTAADIQRFCAERMAAYKVPAHVEMRSEPLPRNPAGKILKAALRGGDTAFHAEADTDQAL